MMIKNPKLFNLSRFPLLLLCILLFHSCSGSTDSSTEDPDERPDGSIVKHIYNFGGSQDDLAYSMDTTIDGGVIITGNFYSNDEDFENLNNGDSDIFVIKLDENGILEWINTFGGSTGDSGLSIIQTGDNGFALAGTSRSNDGEFSDLNKGFWDIVVIKLNPSGEKEWINTYGGSGRDEGLSITETTDGGLVVTGLSESNDQDFEGLNKGGWDIFALKIDFSGNLDWINTYGGSSGEIAHSVSATSDGGVVITGGRGSIDGDFENSGNGNIFLLKLGKDGDLEWINTFGGSGRENGFSVVQSTDNGFIITGTSEAEDGDFTDAGIGNMFVIKTNSDGDLLWSRKFGGSNEEEGREIIETANGDIVFTGWTRSGDGDFTGKFRGGSDIAIFRLQPDGNMKWIKLIGGTGRDRSYVIREKASGSLILAGSTSSRNYDFENRDSVDLDIVVAKITVEGSLKR